MPRYASSHDQNQDHWGLVLFATATREGKTWSARRLVRSGGGDVKLVLADEDPDLGR